MRWLITIGLICLLFLCGCNNQMHELEQGNIQLQDEIKTLKVKCLNLQNIQLTLRQYITAELEILQLNIADLEYDLKREKIAFEHCIDCYSLQSYTNVMAHCRMHPGDIEVLQGRINANRGKIMAFEEILETLGP